MKYKTIENMGQLLVAHRTENGNCDACCFKNWNAACYRLLCQDKFGRTVYWTLSDGRVSDIPFIWGDYMRECMDIKSLCRTKIASAYKTR